MNELRTLISQLDSINTQVKEMIEENDLQDEANYSELYEATQEIETQVTETQEKNNWI